MAQISTPPPLIAQEVLWTYQVLSNTELEKNFYVALKDIVASEIALRIQRGSRIWVGREIRLSVGLYVIHARLTNVAPLLATTLDDSTQFHAEYRERAKDEGQDISAFISEIIRYPNERLGAQ